MEGKKGEDLRVALDDADRERERERGRTSAGPSQPLYTHRRSSSVPLPTHPHTYNPIALPALPSSLLAGWPPYVQSQSRPDSPVLAKSIRAARQQQLGHGMRRASSTQPALQRSWTFPSSSMWLEGAQDRESPLPEMDMSFLNPSFQFGDSAPPSSTADFSSRGSFVSRLRCPNCAAR